MSADNIMHNITNNYVLLQHWPVSQVDRRVNEMSNTMNMRAGRFGNQVTSPTFFVTHIKHHRIMSCNYQITFSSSFGQHGHKT